MEILGIVGSSRKNGNTDILVKKVLEGANNSGITSQLIYLKDYKINDCIGCEKCKKDFKCVFKDGMQDIYPLIEKADAVVIGSPTYFYSVTGIMKNFLDRLYCYEIFDDDDRSVWMGINEVTGIKYAVTVAVCEQATEVDMGYTTLIMNQSLSSLGYRVVEDIRAYNSFVKGDVLKHESQIDNAVKAGIKLAKYLLLNKRIKTQLS